MFLPLLLCKPGVRRRRTVRGFLLLETLFALGVALLLIVSGLSLLNAASDAADSARQNGVAYNAARQAIENVRFFKGAALADGTYTSLTAFGPLPQLAQLGAGSSAAMTVSTSGGLRTVSVTVNWRTGGRNRTRSRRLTTLIASGGVAP